MAGIKRFHLPFLRTQMIAAVIMAWLLRGTLRTQIRPERFETYMAICRRADFDRGMKLLNYPDLDAQGRKEIRRFVRSACLESPPRVLYALTQIHRGGQKA